MLFCYAYRFPYGLDHALLKADLLGFFAMPMIPVVLSGGSGTRLWPLSRTMFPKQFHALGSETSLLQQTLSRLEGLPGIAAPLIVCNHEHRFMVAEQLRAGGSAWSDILLEPVARNTAPASAVAALRALQLGDDPLLLVLPSDHLIADTAAFHKAVGIARQAAQAGCLVTFGIVPSQPETGFGYIHIGDACSHAPEARSVVRFVEKPVLADAKDYVESGDYVWNSGMFVFRASVLLEELQQHAPGVLASARAALEASERDFDFCRLGADEFASCPDRSIDYAVMELTQRAAVVPLDAGWSDVGAWSALWEVLDKDAAGNVLRGNVLAEDSSNNLAFANKRLVAMLGVDDLVVVDTADALLVTRRDRSQDIKKLVERVTGAQPNKVKTHRQVFRPWGAFDSVDNGERYQVKRITVKPGASLSLQLHHHRAEHWIVVSGTALVRRGESEMLLTENQSIYIPVGEIHSLKNPGKIPLELIEVQSGPYLGEDDIVRLEDSYGRA